MTYYRCVLWCVLHYMLIVGLVLLCYVRTLPNPLLYDDPIIAESPDVTGANPIEALWTNDYWGQSLWHEKSHKSHRPVCILLIRLVRYLVGEERSARAYHALNIGLHSIVSILVMHVSSRSSGEKLKDSFFSRSFLSGALFATHPVHVDAVAQLAGTAELLCAMFTLLAFLFATSAGKRRDTRCDYVVVVSKSVMAGLCCVLAMLSKEQGITAMPVLVCCLGLRNMQDILRQRRRVMRSVSIRPSVAAHDLLGAFREAALRVCREQWAAIAIGLALIAAKVWLLAGKTPSYDFLQNPASHEDDPLTRVLSQHQSVARHAGLLLWPSILSVDWSWGSVPLVTSLLDARNISALALYIALAWIIRRWVLHADAHVGASLIWLVIPFLPSSNFAFPVGFILAERVLYTPSVGFCMGLADVLTRTLKWIMLRRPVEEEDRRMYLRLLLQRSVAFGVIAAYAARSVNHVHNFRSEEALFLAGTKSHPNSPNMHYYLGTVYFYRDPKTESDKKALEAAYSNALRVMPSHAETLSNYAIFMYREGRLAEAEPLFARAIESEPHIQHRRDNYALFLAMQTPPRYCEAAAVFADVDPHGMTIAPYVRSADRKNNGDGKPQEDGDVCAYITHMIQSLGVVCGDGGDVTAVEDDKTNANDSSVALDKLGQPHKHTGSHIKEMGASPATSFTDAPRLVRISSGWFETKPHAGQ
eukprot:g3602.t1